MSDLLPNQGGRTLACYWKPPQGTLGNPGYTRVYQSSLGYTSVYTRKLWVHWDTHQDGMGNQHKGTLGYFLGCDLL